MVVDDRVRSSMALYDRAGRLIPGRTQLVSRRASMFAEGVSPVYAQRAKGSRFHRRRWQRVHRLGQLR